MPGYGIHACKTGKRSSFCPREIKRYHQRWCGRDNLPSDRVFQEAFIERKKMQYLYNDGDLFYFMDNETFDQIAVSKEDVGDSLKFVKENQEVSVSLYQEKPFAIEPPLTVELLVTETEPGFKGNTAQGATKPAIVETGAQVAVPLFVEQDEMIKIDTRTGEYLSRV